uniref:Zinc finger matrin-type protein CG9776 n=2 Tax=Cacopsylla melanoneura TaxID=428564 RepID=A0A8D9ABS8_9HEMI
MFVPVSGWYCKLCDTWIGDLHCASVHLKSIIHAKRFNTFIEENPHWEIEWLSDRTRAFEKSLKEKAAAAGAATEEPVGVGGGDKKKTKGLTIAFDRKTDVRKVNPIQSMMTPPSGDPGLETDGAGGSGSQQDSLALDRKLFDEWQKTSLRETELSEEINNLKGKVIQKLRKQAVVEMGLIKPDSNDPSAQRYRSERDRDRGDHRESERDRDSRDKRDRERDRMDRHRDRDEDRDRRRGERDRPLTGYHQIERDRRERSRSYERERDGRPAGRDDRDTGRKETSHQGDKGEDGRDRNPHRADDRSPSPPGNNDGRPSTDDMAQGSGGYDSVAIACQVALQKTKTFGLEKARKKKPLNLMIGRMPWLNRRRELQKKGMPKLNDKKAEEDRSRRSNKSAADDKEDSNLKSLMNIPVPPTILGQSNLPPPTVHMPHLPTVNIPNPGPGLLPTPPHIAPPNRVPLVALPQRFGPLLPPGAPPGGPAAPLRAPGPAPANPPSRSQLEKLKENLNQKLREVQTRQQEVLEKKKVLLETKGIKPVEPPSPSSSSSSGRTPEFKLPAPPGTQRNSTRFDKPNTTRGGQNNSNGSLPKEPPTPAREPPTPSREPPTPRRSDFDPTDDDDDDLAMLGITSDDLAATTF